MDGLAVGSCQVAQSRHYTGVGRDVDRSVDQGVDQDVGQGAGQGVGQGVGQDWAACPGPGSHKAGGASAGVGAVSVTVHRRVAGGLVATCS